MRLIELLTLTSMVASFEAAPIRRRHQAAISSEHNGHHDHHQHHVDLQRRQSGAPQILNNHMSNTINIGAKPNFKKNKGALVDNVMANSINLGIDGNASGKKGKKGRDCSRSKSRSRPSMIKSFMSNSINIGTSAQEDSDDDCGSGGGGLLDNYMANSINVGSLRNLVGGLHATGNHRSSRDEKTHHTSDDDDDSHDKYEGKAKPIKLEDPKKENSNMGGHDGSEHSTSGNSKLPGGSDSHLLSESPIDSQSHKSEKAGSALNLPKEITDDAKETDGVPKQNIKLSGNSNLGSYDTTRKDSKKGEDKDLDSDYKPSKESKDKEFGLTNADSPKSGDCQDCKNSNSKTGSPKPQVIQSMKLKNEKSETINSSAPKDPVIVKTGDAIKKSKGYTENGSVAPQPIQPHKQDSYKVKDEDKNDSKNIKSKKNAYAEQ